MCKFPSTAHARHAKSRDNLHLARVKPGYFYLGGGGGLAQNHMQESKTSFPTCRMTEFPAVQECVAVGKEERGFLLPEGVGESAEVEITKKQNRQASLQIFHRFFTRGQTVVFFPKSQIYFWQSQTFVKSLRLLVCGRDFKTQRKVWIFFIWFFVCFENI